MEFFLLLLELLLEVGGNVTVDFALRALAEIFGPLEAPVEPGARVFAFFGFLALGILLGLWSIFVFPSHIFHPLRIPGLSLIVGPTLAGLVMSFAGKLARKCNKRATLIETFAYGFAVAFGMALIRLLDATGSFNPPYS